MPVRGFQVSRSLVCRRTRETISTLPTATSASTRTKRIGVEDAGAGAAPKHWVEPGGADMPGEQTVHSTAPERAENVSAGQTTQASSPDWAAKEPGAQASQVPPGTGLAEPVGHWKQKALCGSLDVPMAHVVHEAFPVPTAKVPAVQSRQTVLPGDGAAVPEGHGAQLCAPALGLKVPTGQGAHVPPVSNSPGGQTVCAAAAIGSIRTNTKSWSEVVDRIMCRTISSNDQSSSAKSPFLQDRIRTFEEGTSGWNTSPEPGPAPTRCRLAPNVLPVSDRGLVVHSLISGRGPMCP